MRLVIGAALVLLGVGMMIYAWTGFYTWSTPAFVIGTFLAVIGIVIADEHPRT